MAGSGIFHADKENPDVLMVSGFSPSLFEEIVKSEIKDTPLEFILNILNQEEFDCIAV